MDIKLEYAISTVVMDEFAQTNIIYYLDHDEMHAPRLQCIFNSSNIRILLNIQYRVSSFVSLNNVPGINFTLLISHLFSWHANNNFRKIFVDVVI